MAKTKISEFSATSADNTDITNINSAEGCSPANVNNAIRSLMSLLKNQQDGSSGDPFTVAATLVSSGQVDITGAFRLDGTAGASGQALVSAGGANTPTWSTLGTMAAQNSTTVAITGGTITGITDLAVADGGTGASTLTANAVLIGNGTSAITSVAPSTDDNVLISNGTSWTSAAISSISAFDKSLSTNGYQKFPGGLVIQWGTSSGVAADTTVTVTLPIAFTSAFVYANIAIQSYTGGNEEMSTPFVGISTLSNFTVKCTDGDTGIGTYRWIAVGY
jgi:hypothetical protein